MKKRTDEEKRTLIDEACDLINEAAEKTRKAKRLLHLCGIDTCAGIDESPILAEYGSNVQIYTGIKKMSRILGIEPEFRASILFDGKVDKSRCYIVYNGLTFLQVGEERTSTTAKFTFK